MLIPRPLPLHKHGRQAVKKRRIKKALTQAAAVWRPVATRTLPARRAVSAHQAEAVCTESENMAEVKLVNIKKVYPYVSGEEKKKNKKKAADEPEKKKVNLQITDEGVVAVQQFSLL